MLKGIPKIIPPLLLKLLSEMGHGDTLVIADGNFPSESVGKGSAVVRLDGHGVPEVLDAVISLMPLDQYVEQPVALMERCPGDDADISIWQTYYEILKGMRAGDPRTAGFSSGLSSTRRQKRRTA